MEVGSKSMKQDYINKASKTTVVIGVIASIVLGLIRLNLGIGLLLGLMVGFANLWVTTNYIDNLLFKEKFTISTFLMYAVVNYGLMISAFLLSVFIPNWVNIYMVALGLVMLKLVVYVKELVFYKKGGSR